MSAAPSSKSIGPTLASLTVIIVPVIALVAIASSFNLPSQVQATIAIAAVLALTAAAFLLLRRHPFKISGDHLLVRATVGYQRIPLSKITGISKVRRKRKATGSPAEERVEITYTDSGDSRTLLLCPPDPMQFVLELVSHCPHLSAYQETRLIKDASFKDALAEADED